MSVLKFGITPSLLNSFDWLTQCPDSWKAKAVEDLQGVLTRKPFEPTPEAKKGIDLENAVEKYCKIADLDLTKIKSSGHFRKLIELCYGGEFQKWVEFHFNNPIAAGLAPVRAYGKVDVLKTTKIIDIKSTAKYKGGEYYTKGWQPPIYCLATGITRFEFLVAVWEHVDSMLIKDLHIVKYELKQSDERRVIKRFEEFIEYLKRAELYQDYLEIYMKNKLTPEQAAEQYDGVTFNEETPF